MPLARHLFEAIEGRGEETNSLPVDEINSQQNAITETKAGKEGTDSQPPTARGLKARLEFNGFRCEFSGCELQPETISIEHVKPLCRGGLHSHENVVVVHKVINRMKGELTLDEFVGWCSLVANHNQSKSLADTNSNGSYPQ